MGENSEDGVRERIRQRLLEASSWVEVSEIRKALIAEGFKAGSIDAVISEMRRKGQLPPREAMAKTHRAMARREALPAEYLIDMMELPDAKMCRGYKLGQLNLLAAARLLQELARIQAEQVGPVINLVQALRLEEKSAAEAARGEGRAIAHEAAQEVADRVAEHVDQRLATQGRKADIATVPNPLQGMMARMMERSLEPMMDSLLRGLFPMAGQGQGQGTPPGWRPPPGTVIKSREEWHD